jgi:hypothetical protein
MTDAHSTVDVDQASLVIARLTAGGGQLMGDLGTLGVMGVASFSDLQYEASVDGESLSIQFDSDSLPSVTGVLTADVVATHLAFTRHPAPLVGMLGGTIDFQVDPTVVARDMDGLLDLQFDDDVTLSAVGTGTATFTNDTVRATAGVAQFVGLTFGYFAAGTETLVLQVNDTAAGDEGQLSPGHSSLLTFVDATFLVGLVASDNSAQPGYLTLGLASGASVGPDTSLGETELPPVPPGGFDARFAVPGGSQGTTLDLRAAEINEHVWELHLQSSLAGYPLNLAWNSQSLPTGSWVLRDTLSGNSVVDIDMRDSESVSIANTSVSALEILFRSSTDVPLTYRSSWNMTSLPVTPADATLTVLFPDVVSAFNFNGGYAPQTTINTCEGYWFNLTTGGTYTVNGTDVAQCDVTLPSNWSMIGAPRNGVAVSAIVQTPAANIISIFSFSGGYALVDLTTGSLTEGQGFWVNMTAAGQLVMDSASTPAAKPAGTTPLASSRIVVSASGLEQTLWLGTASESMVELPPTPPAAITSLDVRVNVDGVSTWMVPVAGQVMEYPVQLMGSDLELAWDVDQSDVNQWQLVMDGRAQSLSGRGSLSLNVSPMDMALRYTPLPHQFALETNYPNPFNPSTTIRYQLKHGTPVSLMVYDINGQLVRTLVSGEQPAGRHAIPWDGHNTAGSQVGAGVFLYELRAGSFRSVQKMLLMK